MSSPMPRTVKLVLAALLCLSGLAGAGELFRPVPQSAQVTRFNRFNISYALRDVDANGVRKVEFYITEDMGGSWRLYGEDDDRISPMVVEVPGEGVYGFVCIVTDRFGNREREPGPRTMPETVIVVDRTPPQAKWVAPLQDILGRGGPVEFAWETSDQNFGTGPVKIQYATNARSNRDRDAGWATLEEKLDASGKITWSPPTEGSARYNFRLVAEDRAGNLTVAYNPATLVVDTTPPTIVSVSPLSSNKLENDIVIQADDGTGSGVKEISLYTTDNSGATWLLVKETTATSESLPIKRPPGEPIKFTAPKSGDYGLWPVVFDEAGNANALPSIGVVGPYVLTVDTEPPTVTLSDGFLLGRDAVLANDSRRVDWTAYDPHIQNHSAVILLSLDNGSTWQELRSSLPASGSEQIHFPFGSHSEEAKLKVTVADEFGNVGESVSRTFKLTGADTTITDVTPVQQSTTPTYGGGDVWNLQDEPGTAPVIPPPADDDPFRTMENMFGDNVVTPTPSPSTTTTESGLGGGLWGDGSFGDNMVTPLPGDTSSLPGATGTVNMNESMASSIPQGMYRPQTDRPSIPQAPLQSTTTDSSSLPWTPSPREGSGTTSQPVVPPVTQPMTPSTQSGGDSQLPMPPWDDGGADGGLGWPDSGSQSQIPSIGGDTTTTSPIIPPLGGSDSPLLPPASGTSGQTQGLGDLGSLDNVSSLAPPPIGGGGEIRVPEQPQSTGGGLSLGDLSMPMSLDGDFDIGQAQQQIGAPAPIGGSGVADVPALPTAPTDVAAAPAASSANPLLQPRQELEKIPGLDEDITPPAPIQPPQNAPSNPRELSNHYSEESKGFLTEGRYEQALDSANKALAADNRNPKALMALSQVYAQDIPEINNFARAATLAKDATAVGQDWEAWWNCADVFYRWAHKWNRDIQGVVRSGQRAPADKVDERNLALSNAQTAIRNATAVGQRTGIGEAERKRIANTQGLITYLRALTVQEPTNPGEGSGSAAMEEFRRQQAAYKAAVSPILLEAIPFFQSAMNMDGTPSYIETFHLGIVNFRLGGLERDTGNMGQAVNYYQEAVKFLEIATTAKDTPSGGPREAYYMLANCYDLLAENSDSSNRARYKELALRYWQQTSSFYPPGSPYRQYSDQRIEVLSQELGR